MVCYSPLKGFRCPSTGKLIARNPYSDVFHPMVVPCGGCIGCRVTRSREWAIRSVHEASLYRNNCFLTLTYSPQFLPSHGSLEKDIFPSFMKRFRERVAGSSRAGIRVFYVGEYGEKLQRPHYHACIFNYDFPDKIAFKQDRGFTIYRSPLLEELWPFGHSAIGSLTYESAAYVARYVTKKITGKGQLDHYLYVDASTGECFSLLPEFSQPSLKPGIGADWFDRYWSDVYPSDFVVHKGRKFPPPRYYDKLLKIRDPDLYDAVKSKRTLDADSRANDNTSERLAVREQVFRSRVQRLVRNLESEL
nr:MAG: replication initiator protein [Microvirus sp.]